MKEFNTFYFGFIVGWIFCGIIILATSDVFKTKQPVKPDMTIEVKNGVSDTTYIYEFK